MFDFAPVRVHPVNSITHIVRGGRCVECGDTLEWFQHIGEPYVMAEDAPGL